MERAFLRYIYKRYCKFDEQSEKVNDIEKGVKQILNEILEEIAKRHPGLSISKIIEGGSYYEKTKVGAPDEFDFMIVLRYLSLPGAVMLKEGCVPWYKKVLLVEDPSDKYDGVFDTNNLLSNELVTRQFWSRLLSLCKNKTFTVSTQYGAISTKGCKNRKLLLEFKENIPLSDLQENEDDPNSQELIHIPTLEIGVDLMLAIDYPNIKEVVTSDGFPREWRELLENTGCHLVAKTCQSLDPCSTCWHVSLANAEMKLMLDIGEQHRQAYQAMKYLLIREVPYSGKCANLSSYMLKNAFMFHRHGENRCEYTRDASVCVHAVFDYLIHNFKVGKMPCFLSRNIDTWGPDLKFPVLSSEKYPSRFLDDGSLGEEWYALCWLELWRRVVVRADKLLKNVESADDNKIQEKFYLMKESMMLLVECYCKYTNIQQMSLSEIKSLPKGISDNTLERNFAWYFGRLKELFDVKLGDLL